LPFSWRFLQDGWKMLFFKESYYQYDATQTPQWNRGAYLVQGLGHCGECHTPRNVLGAMKPKYFLTGAFIDGYWAPNITKLNFAKNPVPEIVQVFDQAELVNQAGPVRGPMAEVDHNSLMHLAQEDLDAIAAYLKTVKSKEPLIPADLPVNPNLSTGRKVYKKVCAMCHDQGIAGAPIIYDTANWVNRLHQGGISTFYLRVINGYNNMPPKGGCVVCSNKDLEMAVDYIIAVNKHTGMIPQIKGIKFQKPNTSIALGKSIYQHHCAVCHDKGILDAPILGDQQAWQPLLNKGIATLFINTINGIGNMPRMGSCKSCSQAEIIAAVKYMAQEANPKANYSDW
jgi:cytochrome c5